MKQKFCFPGRLWPFRKQHHHLSETSPPTRVNREYKYIIGLLLLWLIVMLFSVLRCKAQSGPIKVGDKLPDIEFTGVLNYKSKTLKLSDFKDKIVVLDFWATWCTSCLAKFPEERQLQQQLRDTLQIILVNPRNTRDTHAKVAKFFSDRHHQYYFPSIDEDTILSKFFPAAAVPHYVWIRNNVVVAIPEPEELTASKIRAVFRNSPVQLASGHKEQPDYKNSLVRNPSGWNSGILYYSFIGAYRQDLYPSFDMQTDSAGNVSRIDAVNLSLIDLIEVCAPMNSLTGQRILKVVGDPAAVSPDSTSLSWRRKHCYIYESAFSPRSAASARALMLGEIERFFQLQVDTTTRDTTCFVITPGDTSKIVHGKKGVHGETNIFDHLNAPVFFRNESITAIASMLEQQSGIPFVNSTGFRARICLYLPADLNDFKLVSASFKKQGFHIARLKRKITFLLIKDKSGSDNRTIQN